jgi:hypothetical protein
MWCDQTMRSGLSARDFAEELTSGGQLQDGNPRIAPREGRTKKQIPHRRSPKAGDRVRDDNGLQVLKAAPFAWLVRRG